MLVKQGYNLYFYRNEKSTIEMDFFIRDAQLPHLPAQTICEKRKIEMQENPSERDDSVFTIMS